MPRAISNTSPLLYLHRIDVLEWLPELFEQILVPSGVVQELHEGQRKNYDVPDLDLYAWLNIIELEAISDELIDLELGIGELSALTLAVEYPDYIVLLDDGLARQAAQNLGLAVWGTLKILLEAKSKGLTGIITPHVACLKNSGMWISDTVQRRILDLAGE